MRTKSRALIACLLTAAIVVVVAQIDLAWAQAGGNLRIIEPSNGEKTSNTWIQIRYELINPAASAASTPTFHAQLDTESPIETTSDSHTFTSLTPGTHTVLIQLVDANGSPVPGSTSAVQFTVAPAPPPPGAVYRNDSGGDGPQKPLPVSAKQQATERDRDKNLPDAGGALPLLSVIGFGVLVGGIVSALKTR